MDRFAMRIINYLIILGALFGVLLLPSAAQTWGVMMAGGIMVSAGKNITFVNHSHGHNDAAETTIVSDAAVATAGNLLVVFVACGGTLHAVTGITDTAGNTYTYITTETRTEQLIECWYAKNALGHATNVVKATYADSVAYRRIIVLEYSGLSTTAPLDTYDDHTTTNATDFHTVATASADSEAVIVAAYNLYHLGRTFVAGTTSQQFTLRGASAGTDTQAEDAILTTSGNKSSQMTITGDISNAVAIHVIFK